MKLFRKPGKYKKELMEHIEELKVALISLRNHAFGIKKQPDPTHLKIQNLRTRKEAKDEINYREYYITTKLRQKTSIKEKIGIIFRFISLEERFRKK